MPNIYTDVQLLVLTLKQVENKLLALGSHPDQEVRSLYRSLTEEELMDLIGQMLLVSGVLGGLSNVFVKMVELKRLSKMDSTTSPSSGDPPGSKS